MLVKKKDNNSEIGADNSDVNDKLIRKYFYLFPKYTRLGDNIKEVIINRMEKEGISYVYVESRVKKLNQFTKKLERKKYKDPFNETEDLCGVRVVCFFQNDIKRIEKIVRKEFDVINNIDKEKVIDATSFGYRSKHYIVKINKEWSKIPNYEGLEDLKAEIQIRTILMHAWAEIEHKLAYKKETHIPPQFRRKFSLLSAKLEETDEQFEILAKMIAENKQKMMEKAQKEKVFDDNASLNLDSLQTFLDINFPSHSKNIYQIRDLLDEILRKQIPLDKVIDYIKKEK